MGTLFDTYGREFSYLRLSITEACNFRCLYCLPDGSQRQVGCGNSRQDAPLNVAEIENLILGFADLGFRKVRLTGGEPTLRPEIVEIVRKIADIPAITTLALTTNGHRLSELAGPLRRAGLNVINVSMDSLDSTRFQEITGSRLLGQVRQGVEEAVRVGIGRVKINVVLLRRSARQNLKDFMEWVRETPIRVRFIELMQTQDNGAFFQQEHLSGDEFRSDMEALGWKEQAREALDGPAREFCHPGFVGRLGIISAYSHNFCGPCNRLRVSSRGKLKLCLFGEKEYSLRHLLQSPEQREELVCAVRSRIGEKASSHFLGDGIYGSTKHLAAIGG